MRKAAVYFNGEFAGTLTEINRSGYMFRYDENWFRDASKPAVSLTLPKTQQEYHAAVLLPFFSNLLSEGANRKLQSQRLKIDEEDGFGLLLATAQDDTAGAVTVKPLTEE
jgi:serine/threonine-protein kinase HipA